MRASPRKSRTARSKRLSPSQVNANSPSARSGSSQLGRATPSQARHRRARSTSRSPNRWHLPTGTPDGGTWGSKLTLLTSRDDRFESLRTGGSRGGAQNDGGLLPAGRQAG